VVEGEAMIDSPPEYQLTCNCGVKISGTNENGLVSLMKRHLESGKFHTAWMHFNDIKENTTELSKILSEAKQMAKGL
jgi:hypothetical protein